ncbi:PREDICTED: uncharacterized protein LOC108505771 isoform X1 [Lepidothrix coronata]|uniref:Uncharacterized protein LOC108505771 isoform X1 n=1 Tax=Lepidothrix coronata TaxID=321398 RepID=A0A6J0ILM4_9PASS|nr:PREDICTED: uncharacterized protein LOC108505771 isoform X1 [Lepidothrix coronata]
MWNCCTLLLEFLGSNAAKFQLLPCLWDSLEKGKGSGACSAALGQPFLSLCNKWINLLFIEKKRTFFSPFFLFFFFLLICTLWAFCGPCWHSQVGFVWRQAGCWNSRGVLCQIHGLCSIPRVVLCGSNLSVGIPGWFCVDPTSVLEFQDDSVPDPWSVLEFQDDSVPDLWSVLEFQGGFVWIQPLCWNSRLVLCSSMVCAGIPGWFSAAPWSVLHSRVVLCGSHLCAGIPRWFCAAPWSVLHSQSGFLWIHPLCWNSRVVLCGSHLCAGIPGWFCAGPAAPAGSAKHYPTFPEENPCFPGHSQAPTNSINPGPGALKPD